MTKRHQKYLPIDDLFIQPIYSCIHCRAHLASQRDLISKSFQGSQGRAYLFGSVVNVGSLIAEERLLLTGLHYVADIYCNCCSCILGWKYEKAFDPNQRYKEGKFIVEVANLIKDNCWDQEFLPIYDENGQIDHSEPYQARYKRRSDCLTASEVFGGINWDVSTDSLMSNSKDELRQNDLSTKTDQNLQGGGVDEVPSNYRDISNATTTNNTGSGSSGRKPSSFLRELTRDLQNIVFGTTSTTTGSSTGAGNHSNSSTNSSISSSHHYRQRSTASNTNTSVTNQQTIHQPERISEIPLSPVVDNVARISPTNHVQLDDELSNSTLSTSIERSHYTPIATATPGTNQSDYESSKTTNQLEQSDQIMYIRMYSNEYTQSIQSNTSSNLLTNNNSANETGITGVDPLSCSFTSSKNQPFTSSIGGTTLQASDTSSSSPLNASTNSAGPLLSSLNNSFNSCPHTYSSLVPQDPNILPLHSTKPSSTDPPQTQGIPQLPQTSLRKPTEPTQKPSQHSAKHYSHKKHLHTSLSHSTQSHSPHTPSQPQQQHPGIAKTNTKPVSAFSTTNPSSSSNPSSTHSNKKHSSTRHHHHHHHHHNQHHRARHSSNVVNPQSNNNNTNTKFT